MSLEYPEGTTPLDSNEIERLRFKHVTTRGQLDHLEQANVQEGLVWLQRYKGTDLRNEEFVRILHKRLLGDVWVWAGTFRRTKKILELMLLRFGPITAWNTYLHFFLYRLKQI